MSAAGSQVIVYGADWCEDTGRARRLLRRLAVPHAYRNIDEDLDALDRAIALGSGTRRTPIVDVAGQALVEPSNETLTAALVGARLISGDQVAERMVVQNVGDAERLIRVGGGLVLYALTRRAPPPLRLPLGLVGLGLLLTGVAGWCPVYHTRGVSSIGGPGDRPTEAERRAWLGGSRPLPD
jgi:glutaredoxin